MAACTTRGIIVSAGGSGSAAAVAELTFGLILSALRHIPLEVRNLKEGRWQTTVGTGLKGKTLGIYAFGRIGGSVAGIGRAFGMRVLCWGREKSTTKARESGFEVAESRAAFFEASDVVSLHLPLNGETHGIVRAVDLERMKPSALLVNTSRAHLVEEGALVAALRSGRPGRAGVDVFEDEPVIGGDHPLLAMDNALCTPHLGYVEEQNYASFFDAAIEQIIAFANGHPISVANPGALSRSRSEPR